MDEIANIEREKYENQWKLDRYRERSPGMRILDQTLAALQMPEGASVCDFGCGTGRAAAAMQAKGYKVTAVDIARNACTEFDGPFVEACMWDLPAIGPFDYATCCDVMEHIPPQKVTGVLKCIAAVTQKAAYFQIARFVDADGLHLCLRPPEWWAKSFDNAFTRTEWEVQPKYLLAKAYP